MNIVVKQSNINNRGVFSVKKILKGEIIEICEIIILNDKDTKKIDETYLYNYYFSWDLSCSALALGYGSLYNHSYTPNAIYIKDFENKKIIFKALSDIENNEEILVNYNGNPECKELVWFDK